MSKELADRGWPQQKLDFFEKHDIRPVRPMRVPYKQLEKKVAFYIKHKIPYWLEVTTNRTTIFASGNWGTHMNKESSFKPNELQFIKKVKQHIISNETYLLIKNKFADAESTKKIKYNYYKKSIEPGSLFENCIEIDLKSAYWEQLSMLPGVIDYEIYEKGLLVDKKTRLACVGTLAKSIGCSSFDGKNQKPQENINSDKTEFLWNTICYKIGRVMAKAFKAAKSDALFFWVDALFIKGNQETADKIIQLFKEAGFKTSVHKCEWIRFDETKIIVRSKEKGKFLTTKTREKITLPNGKKAVKITKKKYWTEERPFPFKKTMTEQQIEQLTK
jgi:hypothetical protein